MTRSKDVTAGLAGAGLGFVFLLGSFQIHKDPSAASVLGPEVFPMLISVAAIACSIALVVRGIRTPADTDAAVGTTAESVDAVEPSQTAATGEAELPTEAATGHAQTGVVPELAVARGKVVVVFAMFTAYVIAFIPVGYLLSTFLFLTALSTYVDRDKLLRNAVVAAVFSVVVYLLFNKGLQVQVPPGLLG